MPDLDEKSVTEVLPEDDFSAEDFEKCRLSYLEDIKNVNKPLFNVMQTASWKITPEKNVVFTFDTGAMQQEFENSKDDFVKCIRESLNNYAVSVQTEVTGGKEGKSHIKSRREKYEDLLKRNPDIELLRQKFNLDIDREP